MDKFTMLCNASAIYDERNDHSSVERAKRYIKDVEALYQCIKYLEESLRRESTPVAIDVANKTIADIMSVLINNGYKTNFA